jgi:dihydrofolate synthase/folylpolyglutamate synthase
VSQQLSLDALERLGWRFGLESITALLSELGDPHLSLRCVHVAGSNGKGSTCAFLEKFLRMSGYRTGLYTSPHLCDIRERFRVDGTWIPPEELERHTQAVLSACGRVREKLGRLPTHFEALTAIAFCWFKERKVDWVVLEVGLGGRLDATNVIPFSGVSVITPITLEHQDILGRSLAKIAVEKAGILKPRGFAVTHQPHPPALKAIAAVAKERGVTLWVAGRDFRSKRKGKGFSWEGPGLEANFEVPDPGGFQVENAALALAGFQALAAQGVPSDPVLLRKALAACRWPGRVEIVRRDPWVLLDGAHNPGAAKALADHLRSRYPGKKWVLLNGSLKDKDHGGMARALAPLVVHVIATEPDSGRAMDGKKTLQAWRRAGVKGDLARDPKKALRLALERSRREKLPLLVTGSLYLVGDVRKALVGMRGLVRI